MRGQGLRKSHRIITEGDPAVQRDLGRGSEYYAVRLRAAAHAVEAPPEGGRILRGQRPQVNLVQPHALKVDQIAQPNLIGHRQIVLRLQIHLAVENKMHRATSSRAAWPSPAPGRRRPDRAGSSAG